MLVFCELRRSEMCFGGEAGPDQCPAASTVKCIHCGRRWDAPNVWAPGRCPGCGDLGFVVARCEECHLEDLDDAREHSRAGKLLSRLIELDFSVDRFNLRWSDVTAEEARGLRVLKEERDRRAEELRKEMEREQALARQRR